MKKIPGWISIIVAVAFMDLANSATPVIAQALKKIAVEVMETGPSPINGLNTVLTERGVLYATADGKYLLPGPLYELGGSVPVNLTNLLLSQKLQAMKREMILYPATPEKHLITVFTDISCGYCRKLHQQMKEYNDLGISIRYLAFPRQGLTSAAAKNMNAVWCSADRKKSLDEAMSGGEIVPASCKTDISRHYRLGMLFGIQGTPAMVLKNGRVIPGYSAPKAMLTMLDAQPAILKTAGQ